MTYIDFLEGLGRVADMANPPSIVDLRRQKYNSDQPTYEYYHKVRHHQRVRALREAKVIIIYNELR